MRVSLPPEKEARLRRHAVQTSKNVGQVIEEAVDRMFEHEDRRRASLEERALAQRNNRSEREDLERRIGNLFT